MQFQCCGWNGSSDFTPNMKIGATLNANSWSVSAQAMLNFCSFSYLWSCVNHRYVDTGRGGITYAAAAVPSACCRYIALLCIYFYSCYMYCPYVVT